MDTEEINRFTENLIDFLENIEKFEPIVIISHDNTDLDGAAAILGMGLILELYSKSRIRPTLLLTHTNQFVKGTLHKASLSRILTTDVTDHLYNTVFLVDTPYIPPYFANGFDHMFLIDHHIESANEKQSELIPHQKILGKIIDPSASSCSEIISQIWSQLDEKYPNKELEEGKTIAQLLLNGILTDSNGLRYSKNTVIPVLKFLTEKGADLPTARAMSIREITSDQKIARIKGAARLKEPIILGKWIVLYTKVNSYESSVCNALLGLGADLAFCVSKRKNGTFRLISRASERFQHAMTFHLGKFMEKLAIQFDGNSGGHKGAAGMNGKGYPDNLKNQIIHLLKKELNNSLL